MRVSDKTIDRVYISQQARTPNYKMVDNHYHLYYEIYYLKKGTCKFFTHEDQFTLHSGDFLILPPKEVHFNRYVTACVRINIYFRIDDLETNHQLFLPNIMNRYIPSKVIHIPSGSRAIVEADLDKMLAEEKINDSKTFTMMPILLKSLFIDFERFGVETEGDSAQDNEIVEAAHYITEHYNLSLTLDGLAGRANLSPTYFSKKFRSITGMQEHPEVQIYVIDSLSTGPEMALIAEKLAELFKEKKDFETIKNEITEYQHHTHLLYALQSLQNLAKNGRINPAVAKVLGLLGIHIIGRASPEGTVELVDKCRGAKKVNKIILEELEKNGYNGRKIRIAHNNNLEDAGALKLEILAKYPFADVSIIDCGALCSYYAEEHGFLIGYEDSLQ